MPTRQLACTYRRRLRDMAQGTYGFVTTGAATQAGVPAVELRKLAARGGLTNVAYGIYKFDDLAVADHAQLMEAVLAAGPGAHLAGESVLAMHDLALVNPAKVEVCTPRRVRARLPAYIHLVHDQVPETDLTVYEGIPSTTVARALVDCVGTVMRDRLVVAMHEARAQGLLRLRDADRVQSAIGGAP